MDQRGRFLFKYLFNVFVAASLLLSSCVGLAHAQTASTFQVTEHWSLGGPEGWGPLLFDARSNLLYVPRTGRVMVVDAETGKPVGEIDGFVDARNVALDEAGKLGYVTDIADGTVGFVRVFDRSTFKLISSIAVGRIPGAIVFDPVTKSVFAFSSRDRRADVIDAVTGTVVASIPLPGKPHLAVTDGKGSLFASFRGIGQMARVDAASRTVTATWPLGDCAELTGLTIDDAHKQLLASCPNRQLIAVDADSGQVVPIGESAAGAGDLAFDLLRGLLISTANSGVLTIFHRESSGEFVREEELATQPRAGTMAFDPNRSRVFLATARFQQRPVNGKGMEEMASRLTPVPGSFVVLVARR
jgi:hypothetical protein